MTTIWMSDLTKPDCYYYRATARSGNVYAEMTLTQDHLDRRLGSYKLTVHISRTDRGGRIGNRQLAAGAALLVQLREQFGAALDAAGFVSRVDTWAGMRRERWFRGEV
jgi:hypothetical protein